MQATPAAPASIASLAVSGVTPPMASTGKGDARTAPFSAASPWEVFPGDSQTGPQRAKSAPAACA
jgi:hypothetical protein